MLNIYNKKYIRLVTIKRPTAWVVVAILLETQDGVKVAVSHPRIVKIIPRQSPKALRGLSLLLSPFFTHIPFCESFPILSPYISSIFGSSTLHSITGLAPQPPTSIA